MLSSSDQPPLLFCQLHCNFFVYFANWSLHVHWGWGACQTPKLEDKVLHFIWPLPWNMPCMVELAKGMTPASSAYRVTEALVPLHHIAILPYWTILEPSSRASLTSFTYMSVWSESKSPGVIFHHMCVSPASEDFGIENIIRLTLLALLLTVLFISILWTR